MENNLLIGDHLLVDKFIFAPTASNLERRLLPIRPLRRGDIVVFKFPEDPERDFIKRVIGLPGEKLEMREKRIYINGKPLDEPYVHFLEPPGILLVGVDVGVGEKTDEVVLLPEQPENVEGIGRAADVNEEPGLGHASILAALLSINKYKQSPLDPGEAEGWAQVLRCSRRPSSSAMALLTPSIWK
jgi:hypothetical protein